MIAGCIERMNHDSCAGCERRDPCQALIGLFGSAQNPLMSFLGGIAKAFEQGAEPKPSALQQEIERHVEPLLASGPVRVDDVARALGYGRQTLYRRLKAEGVTFEQILDRLRRRLATRFLRDGLSVKETAYRLGFSDPAAFSRAFKRWTGRSPSAVSRDS